MDIVLLQLPIWGVGCPPLGLASLKSYLEQNNISCKVFDINAHAYCLRGKKYYEYWRVANGYYFSEDREKMVEYYVDNRALFLYYMNEIRKLDAKIVGCSCQNSSIILTRIFLEDLRNNIPHFNHILGGPEVAACMRNTDELLSTGYIDAVNLDEGEISLVNYFRCLEEGVGEPVAGVVYKKQDTIIRGGPTVLVQNLNKLPFPDFTDFNLKHYFNLNSLPSYTSRGCINKCIYCTARNYMKKFRFRTAQRIFDEIKYLKERHPEINFIRMADNISNSNIKQLEAFCDLMIDSKLGIKWDLENAVIRKEMRTPLYKKLKKAGCTLIGYGVENPSKELMYKVGKLLCRDADIARVLKEGKKAGIYISINIMFGLPGETDEDFNYLMEFLKNNRRAFNMVNPALAFCEFYPGSDGHENPEKYGIDLSKGHLFWESTDETNTYLTRMKRFELFCKKAKKYKLDNLFNIQELPNKHQLLFEYYFASKEYEKAKEEYSKINPDDVTNKLNRIYCAIKNGDFTNVNETTGPIHDVLQYADTFEETFFMTSLVENLKNMENAEIYENLSQKSWKRKLRSFIPRLVGFDVIDKKINSTYSMLKIMDEKTRCYYASDKKRGVVEK